MKRNRCEKEGNGGRVEQIEREKGGEKEENEKQKR